MIVAVEPGPFGIIARLWVYQRERFPLAIIVPMLLTFSVSSVSASAHLAGRPMPGLRAYAAAFILSLSTFWALHVAQEIRDAGLLKVTRPDLPIQRGLVSLRLIGSLGAAAIGIALAAALAHHVSLLLPLGAVLIWVGLVAAGFFMPRLLRATPPLNLLGHTLAVPLIILLATACEWGPWADRPPPGLWTLLVMSLANGCIIEISRKIRSPVSRKARRGYYSSAWGLPASLMAIGAFTLVAYGFLVAYGAHMGMELYFAEAGLLVCVPFFCCLLAFARHPIPVLEKTVAAASRIWIAACYAVAAGLPFIWDR